MININWKSGQTDVLFIIVGMIVFAIVLLVGLKVINEFTTPLTEQFPDVPEVQETFIRGQAFFTAFNIGFIVLFVFGLISAMATGFFVDTHPVLSFVAFLLLIIFTVLAGFLSNFYEEITLIPELSTEVASFTNITFFMAHLPKFLVLTILFTMIITYAKLRRGSFNL